MLSSISNTISSGFSRAHRGQVHMGRQKNGPSGPMPWNYHVFEWISSIGPTKVRLTTAGSVLYERRHHESEPWLADVKLKLRVRYGETPTQCSLDISSNEGASSRRQIAYCVKLSRASFP
ncbi:hypothetical protein, partial [Rhodopirellula bahusiensis]|uniref:hypothetical protein n=1 Tax=Rhodopirellula bahusiensis TaxID=2014065 RepID=UPI0032976401